MRVPVIAPLAAAVLALTLGCGARTGLFSSEPPPPDAGDASNPPPSLGCPYTTGAQAGAPWPMKNRCPDQDSRGDAVVAPNPRELWSLPAGRYPGPPALGADGTAYVTADANLLAVSPTGAVRWTFTAPSPLFGSPALARDGTLFVVSSSSLDGMGQTAVVAVTPAGSSLWTHDLGPDTPSSPILAPDGTIYFAGSQALYALSPTDGSEKWHAPFPTNGYNSYTSPAVGADGTVYVGLFSLKNLVAITPSGVLKWSFDIKQNDPRFEIGADISADPVVGPDGTIYIASGIRDPPAFTAVFAVRPDGSLRWTHDFSQYGDVANAAAVARDGSVVFANSHGTVARFSADGQLAWSYDTKDVATSLVLDGDGTAFVGGLYDNALTAIAPDGTPAWTHGFAANVDASVVTASGGLLVSTSDGLLHSLGP